MSALTLYQAPQPSGPAPGGGDSRAFSFVGQQGLMAGAPQDSRKQSLLLEDRHNVLHVLITGKKQWLPRNLGQTYLLVLEGLLGRQEATMGLSGVIKAGVMDIVGTFVNSSWRQTFCVLGTETGSIQLPVSSSAGILHLIRNTAPPERLPKDFLSSQPPLDTTLDMTPPSRGPRHSFTYKWADTSPFYQEACTNL